MTNTITSAAPGQPDTPDIDLELAHIPYDSDGYYQTLELREQVLRAPLGLSVWDEDLEAEAGQHHFALLDGDGQALACLVVVPIDDNRVKLRQMAVADHCRGRGLGRRLMQELESLLRDGGISEISLHARVSAEGFYERLGYQRQGEVFIEVTVPHCLMVKELN